jgi:hypothetical protein
MTTIIDGSAGITFPNSTTQASAGLTAASPTIASGVLTYPDATTQSSGSGVAKAWVNYKGTATRAINASYNVSSVTVNGTGDYTFNFTNAFADANYSVVTTSTAAGSVNFQSPLYSQTTTNFSIYTSNGTTLTDSSAISAAVFR